MQKLYTDYKDKGFTLVAINTDDDKATISKYLTENHFDMPVVMAVKTPTAEDYKVGSWPTNILLDKNGKVILRMEGFDEKQIRAEIEKLIAAS